MHGALAVLPAAPRLDSTCAACDVGLLDSMGKASLLPAEYHFVAADASA